MFEQRFYKETACLKAQPPESDGWRSFQGLSRTRTRSERQQSQRRSQRHSRVFSSFIQPRSNFRAPSLTLHNTAQRQECFHRYLYSLGSSSFIFDFSQSTSLDRVYEYR